MLVKTSFLIHNQISVQNTAKPNRVKKLKLVSNKRMFIFWILLITNKQNNDVSRHVSPSSLVGRVPIYIIIVLVHLPPLLSEIASSSIFIHQLQREERCLRPSPSRLLPLLPTILLSPAPPPRPTSVSARPRSVRSERRTPASDRRRGSRADPSTPANDRSGASAGAAHRRDHRAPPTSSVPSALPSDRGDSSETRAKR